MDLPDPGIEPGSPSLQEDSLPTRRTIRGVCQTSNLRNEKPSGEAIKDLADLRKLNSKSAVRKIINDLTRNAESSKV